jgi:hypothetical protein
MELFCQTHTMVRYFLTHVQHGLVEDRLHQWHTATTTTPCFRARLNLANSLACTTLDIFNDVPFCDIVARAYLGVVVSVVFVLVPIPVQHASARLTNHRHSLRRPSGLQG